jgi:IclR family transcriptional regulator, KDG regulon repressor
MPSPLSWLAACPVVGPGHHSEPTGQTVRGCIICNTVLHLSHHVVTLTRVTSQQRQTGAAKIMAVLEALASGESMTEPHGMTVSQVARSLGRDTSIVSRQLKSLLESGLVSRNVNGSYELSWRLHTLAQRAGDQRLLRIAIPLMRQLAATVRERTHLTVLSADEVLTVHSESSMRSIESTGWVGRSIPVASTSSGMALLLDHDDQHILDLGRGSGGQKGLVAARKFLTEVRQARELRYAVANRLFDPDLIGIASPLRDASGRIIAAVNISGPAFRIEGHIPQIGRHVATTAVQFTRAVTGQHSA